jgi:oligopeptidase B
MELTGRRLGHAQGCRFRAEAVTTASKRRRLNAVFATYLHRRWVRTADLFHGELSTRRHFTFGLAAAGVVPLAARLPLSPANAVEMAVHPAPVAPVMPRMFEAFGGVRIDNYDWLRDRKDPRVVAYLDAENDYANARLEPIKPLVDELAAELKAREAQEDASVPTANNGYLYERRFTQGGQYPSIVRRRDAFGAPEEVVLDVGVLAAGHPRHYQVGSWSVSPDNTRVAFAVDLTGGREFRIFVRSIATGETVDQGIDDVALSMPLPMCAADTRKGSAGTPKAA